MICPFVLIADIDNDVMVVTTVVVSINNTASPKIKKRGFFNPQINSLLKTKNDKKTHRLQLEQRPKRVGEKA